MEKKWDTVIPADLNRLFCKWDIYVPLVTKGLNTRNSHVLPTECICVLRMALKQTVITDPNNIN